MYTDIIILYIVYKYLSGFKIHILSLGARFRAHACARHIAYGAILRAACAYAHMHARALALRTYVRVRARAPPLIDQLTTSNFRSSGNELARGR